MVINLQDRSKKCRSISDPSTPVPARAAQASLHPEDGRDAHLSLQTHLARQRRQEAAVRQS